MKLLDYKKIIIVFIIALIGIIIGIIWWQNGNFAVDKTSLAPVIFVVNKGDGVREISSNLKDQKLIRDPTVFFLITKFYNLDTKIQAGNFRLNRSMSATEIAESLTHGTLDIWVTIPEGLRAEEVAKILEENMPTFENSWVQKLKTNEGYLFPDTYLFPKDADIDVVIKTLKDTHNKKYESVKSMKSTNLSEYQTVILASLIEREAKFDKDRPLVASVIMNRLELGMPLQIDATVQYALGFDQNSGKWWKKDLTLEDLKTNSPYNTYINPGLPPRPISNPGLFAIEAALNPAKTDYLYYITDKNGVNRYSTSLDGHNNNIENYGL